MLTKLREFTILTKALSSFFKLIILLVVAIVLILQLTGSDKGTDVANVVSVASTFGVVDALNGVPIDVNLQDNIDTFEVYKMPEFAISLPDSDWFSYSQMQNIAASLGFTQYARVMNFGSQVAYEEDVAMVIIDPKMGQVDYSTAFNIDDSMIPDSTPTAELATTAVKEFFTESGLPSSFFNLDAMEFEYMNLDELGSITPVSVTDSGPLIRVMIPYEVVGVRMMLPIESYAVIDGDGTIRLLTVLIPNIVQTDQTLTLMSWNKAKKLAEGGNAAVINYGSKATTTFEIDSSYPAYYINQRDFYSIDSRRIFEPVYIFEGDSGRVAVLAEAQ